MILAGDIGGTKTALALFELSEAAPRLIREATFSSRDHAAFHPVLDAFLASEGSLHLDAVCLGVAGPVEANRVTTTNLPWVIEGSSVAARLGAPTLLVNDLIALAHGLMRLPPDAFALLQEGAVPSSARGNVAVIAPGTGLGEALLYFDGTRHVPVASEGGHADFAPRNDVEVALLEHLRKRFGHVSYERILSGDGFASLYQFLRDTGRADSPPWLEEQLASGDANARITEAGLAAEAEICVQTLQLFVSILGAEAGNLALRYAATEGVVIGGGIAPKILSALRSPHFLTAFRDKGRFASWLEQRRVQVVLEPRAALLGAAFVAYDRL